MSPIEPDLLKGHPGMRPTVIVNTLKLREQVLVAMVLGTGYFTVTKVVESLTETGGRRVVWGGLG